MEGKLATAKIGGYYEADFLSAGTTSNNRQSNSYTWRTRQAFAPGHLGQRLAIDWRPDVDTGDGKQKRHQQPARSPTHCRSIRNTSSATPGRGSTGFRVVKNFDDKFALAFPSKAPQSTIGGRGFSTVTTINGAAAPAMIVTSGATTSITGNFFINAPGAGGGLYNAFDANGYTVNKAPDLIVKAAADPGFGHYELFGIVSFFRDRIYPCGVVGTNAKDTAPPVTPTDLHWQLLVANANSCEQLRCA